MSFWGAELQLPADALGKALGKQQKMAQRPEVSPITWKNKMEFWASGFDLACPRLLWVLKSMNQDVEDFSLFLPVCFSAFQRKKQRTKEEKKLLFHHILSCLDCKGWDIWW